MTPLLEVQGEINRAYASIRYGTSNSRRLKHDERDELEVVVKVTEGSSLYDAELWKHFSAMAQAAVGRMNGTEIVVTVLGTAAMVAGTVWANAWLAQRRQEKELDHEQQMSQEDTRRLELLTQALARQPSLVLVQHGVQAAQNEFLKVVKPGDTITLGEQAVTAQEAAALVQTERERAREIRFEGEFLVLGNRTDKSAGFRITVQRLSDKLTLNADVPIELPYEQQKMIQEAEWKKKRIALSIDAVMLRDSISQATVISASAPRER